MKKILCKIVILLSSSILVSSCHTLHHNGFELNPLNKLSTNKRTNDNNASSNKPKLLPNKKETKIQKVSEKTEVKQSLNKLKKLKLKLFNPKSILNLSEKELIKKMGKSAFVKNEGKLKNHQYYFSNCFVDIFVIKKESDYFVDFFQTRPVKLNGFLNKEICFRDISKKIKNLKQ